MTNQYPRASSPRSFLPLAVLSLALLVLGVVVFYRMIVHGQIIYHPQPPRRPVVSVPRAPISPPEHTPQPPPVKPPTPPPPKPSLANDLCTAAMNGNLATVKRLLAAHPTLVNVPDTSEEGAPPLLWAMNHAHRTVVDYLLAQGANVNASGKLLGKNALHIAAFQGDADLVNTLLAHGAVVNTRERDGGTAFFIAVGKGHLAAAKVLLRYHADVNMAEITDNWTPLHAAINGHHPELVPLLLAHGAKVTLKTKHDGFTPLALATLNQEQDVVKLLKKAGAKR